MKMTKLLSIATLLAVLVACSPAGGEKRGHEFMPDMAHSVAYESNIYNYYGLNTFSEENDYKKYAMPKEPVAGTVARGAMGLSMRSPAEAARLEQNFKGLTQTNEMAIPVNGSVAYDYGDSDAERTRAANEITQNPLPITASGLAQGKELYDVFCGICHGKGGGGDGHLAREGGPYPAVPANLLDAKFRDTTDGLYYHAIMQGKNVMGAYADKMSYSERWNVIHYIRSLQAKDQKLAYNEEENTLNSNMTGASFYASFEAPEVMNRDHFALGHGDDHSHDAHHGAHHDEHKAHEGDHEGHGDGHDHGDNHNEDHGHDHQEGDHGHDKEHK